MIEGCPKPIEDLMTSCWDPCPEERPSMEHVVEIMRTLCEFFPNADEPLDYSKIEDVSMEKLRGKSENFLKLAKFDTEKLTISYLLTTIKRMKFYCCF